jgi:hypothetical protein
VAKSLSTIKNQGIDTAAPSQKRTSGLPIGSPVRLGTAFCRCASKIGRKPLATALWGRASRTACCSSPLRFLDVDRRAIECQKLSASEAPVPGRHHVGIPGDFISECPGDFIGIRTKTCR